MKIIQSCGVTVIAQQLQLDRESVLRRRSPDRLRVCLGDLSDGVLSEGWQTTVTADELLQ